jgi:hypothetical protein
MVMPVDFADPENATVCDLPPDLCREFKRER